MPKLSSDAIAFFECRSYFRGGIFSEGIFSEGIWLRRKNLKKNIFHFEGIDSSLLAAGLYSFPLMLRLAHPHPWATAQQPPLTTDGIEKWIADFAELF